ncbi:MAG TPA: hypothetical protein VJ725_22045 [Thermoanaerobaculia bacterium]|nr:hypothetical protein [Thermoanaerobaculia bacterium]
MSRFCRTILPILTVLAIAAAAPAFADPASAAAPVPAGQESLAPGAEAALCKAPDIQAAIPPQPEFMAQGFRGYCRCSCSLVKNCNTSADCGGSACLGGVTCC